MSLESTSRRPPQRERTIDAPRDKPRVERGEHANLERPGAQFHPVARGWQRATAPLEWPRQA